MKRQQTYLRPAEVSLKAGMQGPDLRQAHRQEAIHSCIITGAEGKCDVRQLVEVICLHNLEFRHPLLNAQDCLKPGQNYKRPSEHNSGHGKTPCPRYLYSMDQPGAYISGKNMLIQQKNSSVKRT